MPQAGDHHRAHLRMLEANPVERVVELDVHAEVVAVQLQLVAGADAAVLGDAHAQRRDRSVEPQRPVPVTRGVRLVVDAGIDARQLGGVVCGAHLQPFARPFAALSTGRIVHAPHRSST